MAIIHDAYMFQPEDFVDEVAPFIENIQRTLEGYSLLRSHAIYLYDSSPQVRILSEEYGGWERNSIMTQIPNDRPRGPEDVVFWFVLLLYHHLSRPKPHQLGLGANLDLMYKVAEALDWNKEQRNDLLKGRSFEYLIQTHRRIKSSDKIKGELANWNNFRLPSTGGHVGWLDNDDVQRLLEKLMKAKSRLSSLQIPGNVSSNSESMTQVFQATTEMLLTAQKEYCGLCLICSG